MGSEARPLYGGAMSVELPRGWLDASDVRPVPDHQEVFTEAAGAQRSIVIELVEPLDGTADALACVREHFEELASIFFECAPPPHVPFVTSMTRDASRRRGAGTASATPRAPNRSPTRSRCQRASSSRW